MEQQLHTSHSADSLEERPPIHSQAFLGPPPTSEGLADIVKGYINGKVFPKSHATPKRSPKFRFRKEPGVTSLPTVTTGAIATHQQPRLRAVEQRQSEAIEQPQPRAIEYSRWRDRLLHPRLAAEQEVCIELERELSPDEKQRYDTFRQYLRDAATGGNPQNKVEARAFQPFRNRTRLSWRVVEIAENEETIPKNGEAAQTKKGSPYICIEGVRTKENAQNLHAFLSKREVRAEYHPPFKLCYSLARIEAPFFPNPSLPKEEDTALYTMCGQLVMEKSKDWTDGHSAFTIGGLVQIGDGVFALSSWHDAVSEETSEADKGSIELQDSTDYDNDFEPALILEPESPGHGSNTTGQSLPEMGMPTLSTENSAKQLTDLVGDMVLSGDEWCLYSVEDLSRHLPNRVSRTLALSMLPPNTAGRTYIDTFATRPINGPVVVVSGRSGLVQARMSPNDNDIFLPSGKVLEVWRITFEGEGIRPGDSGSWVVDIESGVVFGHIIAMTNNAAYVLPTRKIFKDIDSRVGTTPGCRLVSAFDCLADLAKFHVKSSPAQAETSAREAISSEVLGHSGPSASVRLVQEYLRGDQRSPEEEGILMQLLERSGSNLHHFVISGSALVQATETELADHDNTFRAVLNELRRIARHLQDMESSWDPMAIEYSESQQSVSRARSARSASIVEERRPSSEYSVEDMDPDINSSADAWVKFLRARFAHRQRLVNPLEELDWDVIRREQRRVVYLRRHFGTDRVHSREQGYLLDELGSTRRLWRKSAASRADALIRQGKHRALSVRDSMIVYRVRHWRHDSTERQNMYAQGPYDGIFFSEMNVDDGQDDVILKSGWGYAGVMDFEREAGGINSFESQRLPMKDLLSVASGPPSQTDGPMHGQSAETNDRFGYSHLPADPHLQTGAPRHGKPGEMHSKLRYFHIPANHTRWVEGFMSTYYKVSRHDDLPYGRNLMQMNLHPNSPIRWNRRQHENSLAPVHARQIVPHASTSLLPPCDDSTEIDRPDQYVSLFIPYLSTEEFGSVQRTRNFVRAADSALTDQDRVPIADQGTSRTGEDRMKQANPLADFLDRVRGRKQLKGSGQRTANGSAWLPIVPLARYLICAARLYKVFEEAEMVEIINQDVRGPLPVHMRRTLEQYRNWPSADQTNRQDIDQTTRQESLRQRKFRSRDFVHTLSSPLVMVDQLWLWILDDKTILSSFPRSWGDRHGQSSTDVYSNIDRRLKSAHPEEIESAYDVALVIVEECSKALFRQDTGVDVMGLYGSAISRIATTISAAYTIFKSDARAASVEDTLSSIGTLLRRSQDLSKQWRTLDEVEGVMKELKAMGKVLSQQVDVLAEFESILQRLDHDKVKNRVSILVKEITTRRSEIEQLNNLAKAVTVEFGKLEDLQQQQVSTAHARIALQGVYEQGLHHANSSSSSTAPRYQINSKGRVVSARGRGFIEKKKKGKDSGSSVMVNRDEADRPSVWARMVRAIGLKKRDTASEKRLGADTIGIPLV